MRINIFVVINQINKHKAKIYNQCTYTPIIIKKIHNYIIFFSSLKYKKKFVLSNIRMMNLQLDELRLIAQIWNISDYENKSKEDLVKSLSETKSKPETKPKQETKPEIKPKQIPKPQTPKPEPKIRVKTSKSKLKKLRKDFDELRHKFSKKEIKEYRKVFMLLKPKISFWIRFKEDKQKSY